MECLLCLADVLGGMSVGVEGSSVFIDGNGTSQSLDQLIVTEQAGRGYPKTVTKIKTPKVCGTCPRSRQCATSVTPS